MLKLINVTKKYQTGDIEITAVKNLSLTLEKGCFAAVTGKSGSGKSTLLNLIGGLDSVTNGNIIINGTDITHMKENKLSDFRRKNIGFVFQFFNLIPELDAKDNIMLAQQLSGSKPDTDYYNRIIDILGIGDRQTHLPSQLSGGQKQRVAIARALIPKPLLLLLDEPTGNLDSKSSSSVINMIKELKDELGQTVIMVTHDMEIASQADHIITLQDGSIILDQ